MFYYNIDIIDDNTHTDQWNSYLIRNRYYPEQDLHASHFQMDSAGRLLFARKTE
jgi:hypothetical protein